MSTENLHSLKQIARLAAVIAQVKAAGAEAFHPVLTAEGEYVVSPLLEEARAALEGAKGKLEEKAVAAFTSAVGNNVYRLDSTDEALAGEASYRSSQARHEAARKGRAA